MAQRLSDGSIQMADGRIVYANSLIQAQDLLEILPLVTPPPAWPFVSGGGGGAGVPGGVGGSGGDGAVVIWEDRGVWPPIGQVPLASFGSPPPTPVPKTAKSAAIM